MPMKTSNSNICKKPSKLLKVISQLQGVVEVCCREAEGAFIRRELDDLLMLQYPEADSPHYEAIVNEKVNHVRREEVNIVVEGDRNGTTHKIY